MDALLVTIFWILSVIPNLSKILRNARAVASPVCVCLNWRARFCDGLSLCQVWRVSFQSFWFYRADRQTESQRRINAILTLLLSASIITHYCPSVNIYIGQFSFDQRLRMVMPTLTPNPGTFKRAMPSRWSKFKSHGRSELLVPTAVLQFCTGLTASVSDVALLLCHTRLEHFEVCRCATERRAR